MSTITARLQKFLSSPMNQTGLILFGSTVAGAVAQYADHKLALSVLVGTVVAGIAHVVVPDNTALTTDASQLVKDGLTAWATKNPAEISAVLSDAAKVAADATAAPATK